MRLMVTQEGGKTKVVDADTGKPLDWPEQVGIDMTRGTPYLWLGTTKFVGVLNVPPVVPVPLVPVPSVPTQ
jgi:hypothetical protein